ncbi:MAG: hypothetical protein ACUVXA_17325 [Candidatus Jordarchaeum sp.]|uniref:hypothetical protein n=1 Tax=Candidatus Jordarchaeum sp. TaxID=2823881 RepID=UPI004049C90A
MRDKIGNEEKFEFEENAETQIQNITLWRCETCGGLNKTEEPPELCELCGEGTKFEKMQLKIKTTPT